MKALDTYSATSSISASGDPSEVSKSHLPERVWRRFLKEGFFGLGEDYADGRWSSPSLDETLFTLLTEQRGTQSKWNLRILGYLLHSFLFNPQTGRGVFAVGERHYDLGNDLFECMLDGSMSYTSGIWRGAATLEEAQRNKLKTICDKLELQPGMRVLDIGCGWGNFAEFAAREYGASVIGLTISVQQAEFARKRCKDLPVEIRLEDYRSFNQKVDRVVSIEMIEAVGRKNLGSFYSTVRNALVPGGVFVLQAISTESFNRRSSPCVDQYLLWLMRHIFPHGYLPRPGDLTNAHVRGFSVESNESFGTDYDRTLQAWAANFERAWPQLMGRYDERFRRIWQYYLCGCRAFFRAGLCSVYQIKYRREGAIS